MTRVLVTNDDGIESAGLHVLAAALDRAGYEVIVIAPDRDRSGIGAAIGLVHADQHLDVEKVEMPGCDGIAAYAIDGPPGLCVCAGRLGAFGDPPDIVVSGVNPGCNTGRAILHSGTVGAALTAQSFGCSALAVSVDVSDEWRFDTAARVALDVLPMLLDAPARSVLNLNVPARSYDDVLGVRWARLAAFGSVRAAIAEAGDRRLQFELRATGVAPPPDSDQGLIDAGFASLTTIVGVAEAWPSEIAGAGAVSSHVVPGASVEAVHAVPDASAPRSLHRPLHLGAVPPD
ncbi:MAG TPA: 5'/3'-nucleotidase SurE [Acidimicrobiia bacterium]